ncbi:MAG: DUF4136 domain-containing protein [Verrucomicrobiota bacterium]
MNLALHIAQDLNFSQLYVLVSSMKNTYVLLIMVIFLAGCATGGKNPEFVKSITFSNLHTFSYEDTLVSGKDIREGDKGLLEQFSENVITQALLDRGFVEAETESDFYVVVKWRKFATAFPNAVDSIDPLRQTLNRQDDPSYRFARRFHLILEMFDRKSGELFWSKELPNIFDAIQFTEGRVQASLERSIKNFPEHVERDPNLPDIQ